jgi:hypothetical protein
MLAAMFDGRAHSAGALATISGVTAATASGHLTKLRDGGLVTVAAQGRHRYYRLTSAEVAVMLKGIMTVSGDRTQPDRATSRVPSDLREARTCYDHIAGRLGSRSIRHKRRRHQADADVCACPDCAGPDK